MGVAVSNDTIFVPRSPNFGSAICKVDRVTGVRTVFSDFSNSAQGPLVQLLGHLSVYP
jgi:hypothetical protein